MTHTAVISTRKASVMCNNTGCTFFRQVPDVDISQTYLLGQLLP